MRIGVVISILLHAGLLAWALISIQTPRDFRAPKIEPMAVSFITADELTRLKQGARDAKQKDATAALQKKKTKTLKTPKVVRKAPPAVKPLAAEPPAATPPVAKPEPPKPKPKVDPIAEALAKAEKEAKAAAAAKAIADKKALQVAKALALKKAAAAKKKAEAKKKAAAKRKKKRLAAKRKKQRLRKKRLAAKKRKAAAERKRLAALKKKRTFDADRFSALLNKDPNEAAPRPSSDKPLPRTKKARAGLGAPEGRDDRLTASEEAVLKGMISRQLAGCWSLPGGGGGSQVARVTLSWRLGRDGRLDGEPRVVAGRNDTKGRIAREAAIRAVKVCAPFSLPADKYRAWKLITWEFDPRQML